MCALKHCWLNPYSMQTAFALHVWSLHYYRSFLFTLCLFPNWATSHFLLWLCFLIPAFLWCVFCFSYLSKKNLDAPNPSKKKFLRLNLKKVLFLFTATEVFFFFFLSQNRFLLMTPYEIKGFEDDKYAAIQKHWCLIGCALFKRTNETVCALIEKKKKHLLV